MTRICGVCPASHHLASAQAVDGCFDDECAPLAHKLREMYYQAHFIHSHIAHFYALAAPDFILGPDADPATRNVLGVVAKVGLEIGGAVIGARAMAQEIQRIIGGRYTQDVWCLPGGVSKGLKPEELEQIRPMVDELYDFAQFSLQLFRDVVLGNAGYVDLIVNGPYTLDVHNMGLVDGDNAPNFYDGQVRVVDFEGRRSAGTRPRSTRSSWPSTWSRGPTSSSRTSRSAAGRASSRARTRACTARRRWRGSTWPTTWLRRRRKRRTRRCSRRSAAIPQGRCSPTTGRVSWRWSRTPRRSNAIATTRRSRATEYRVVPRQITGEGVGIVEAMRGTLTHHYTCDDSALCTSANLIVGTTNNNAPIQMVTKKVARA